jgi:DNA-binding NarL/FixJ family response regulator
LNRAIEVLIVTDDWDWRQKLTGILQDETDLIVAGVSDNIRSAVEVVLAEKPEVILMDQHLMEPPDRLDEGFGAIRKMTAETGAKIILLSNFEDKAVIHRAGAAGVQDFVYKDRLYCLCEKIRDVYHQHSPTLVLLEKLNELEKEVRFSKLTPAEKEILILLKEGVSIAGIVQKLCKTEKTVHNQKSSFLKKLAVKCYKEALDLYKDFI